MNDLPDAVVVFGAAGFLGRNIVDTLKGRVGKLIGIGSRVREIPGCDIVGTMDDLRSMPALPPHTVAINVAAYRYDARTFAKEQTAILQHNVAIANAVYGFCAERQIREVRLASSVAVYPASATLLDDEVAVDLNDWPNAGEAAYAWSKRWSEICAELYRRQFGINSIVFRLSNPYGPYDTTDFGAAHVASAFVIKALLPGDTFEIMGNPDGERDFVFAGDVAMTFAASLQRRGESGTYNLGFGQTTTIRNLAAAVLREAGSAKRIAINGSSTGVTARRVSATRVKQHFALAPFATLDQGLAPTLAWYRNALAQ